MNPKKIFTLDCRELSNNERTKYLSSGRGFKMYHEQGDPSGVHRLHIHSGELEAVLFPSKGLSLGQVFYKGKPVFWDAPCSLPDPETLNLWSDEVCINGKPTPGFAFLPTFCSGVELYGLKNWGMPQKDKNTGELFLLHGETSNIPVTETSVEIDSEGVTVTAAFIYHDMKGSGYRPWYKEGDPWFRVKKYFRFETGLEVKVIIRDTIENISTYTLTPDWGYHITFRPEEGSRLLVGSRNMEERSGGILHDDVETWTPQTKPAVREEKGIIHKELMDFSPEGRNRTFVLLKHPDGEGVLYKFPKSPYFQTWSCRGGAGSGEFTLKNGESLLKKNWDGLGIEIGSSALDHNGNIDESVRLITYLRAGQEKVIEMEMMFPDKIAIDRLEKEISQYNKSRNAKA
jgi:hypothetical protein